MEYGFMTNVWYLGNKFNQIQDLRIFEIVSETAMCGKNGITIHFCSRLQELLKEYKVPVGHWILVNRQNDIIGTVPTYENPINDVIVNPTHQLVVIKLVDEFSEHSIARRDLYFVAEGTILDDTNQVEIKDDRGDSYRVSLFDNYRNIYLFKVDDINELEINQEWFSLNVNEKDIVALDQYLQICKDMNTSESEESSESGMSGTYRRFNRFGRSRLKNN